MRSIFSLFIFITASFLSYGNTVKYTGSVGPYNIEMELSSFNRLDGTINGKYRYTGKENYLELKGMVFDEFLELSETYDGENTGNFYLELEGDELNGKWVSEKSYYVVHLDYESGDKNVLKTITLEDLSKRTNSSITGSYGVEQYFINDMSFTEENHQLEIGFNGGYFVAQDLGGDSINFQVEVVCGPTYHFAFASGIAHKKGDKYICHLGDECTIEIVFGEKRVHVEANASYDCGFGARAYLEHDFVKINDGVQFGDNVSLGNLKRMDRTPQASK